MTAGLGKRVPISVVCVFNDLAVREQCLDASLAAGWSPNLEYVPVDNTTGAFPTAGAALNHGVRQARHRVVALVHQDVYLHKVGALFRAAELLVADLGVGLVGAVGMDRHGDVVGRIRDRVDMSGRRVLAAEPVDSVDEVVFLVERDRLLLNPLSEDPDLGWHAYAVEYGARLRRDGLQVVVADIPLTHNSLTANLARLDVAHRAVARKHRELLPLNTTCGTIRERPLPVRPSVYRRVRREARLTRDLLRARRHVGWSSELWLTNIRFEIDHLMAGRADSLEVLNVVRDGHFPRDVDPLTLTRRGRQLVLSSGSLQEARDRLAGLGSDQSCLVTDVPPDEVGALLSIKEGTVAGFDPSTGFWVAAGVLVRGEGAQRGRWRRAAGRR